MGCRGTPRHLVLPRYPAAFSAAAVLRGIYATAEPDGYYGPAWCKSFKSKDGKRWALGRYVKRSLPNRCWEPVEVWSLRCRDENGKAIEVAHHCSRKDAERWVSKDGVAWFARWVRFGL